MNAKQQGMEKSRRPDDLHRLRLMALLDAPLRENAVSRPTADLDVGHGTLTASLGSERLYW